MKKIISVLFLIFSLIVTGCSGEGNISSDETQKAEGTFTFTFITVGKGDAFLMETPKGQHYLMDTGKAQDYQQIVKILRTKDVAKLDGIFLSHGHKDHAGCLKPLLEDMPVDKVYISKSDTVSYTEIKPRDFLPEFKDTQLVELIGGESFDLGGVQADVWIPPIVDYENENNNSLILKITHGENSFLLMGDVEMEEEAVFMNSDFPLKSKVLKLGHHGETDATSAEFLDRVNPEIAIIAGNAEENPDSENPFVASLLKNRNIDYYYSKGPSLDFISDGKEISIKDVEEKEFKQEINIKFSSVQRKAQKVTIKNEGETSADLYGCTLISERGDEIYHFPKGTILAPGEEISVVCKDSEEQGELIWNEESVWRKRKDNALLYDKNMNLLDSDISEK